MASATVSTRSSSSPSKTIVDFGIQDSVGNASPTRSPGEVSSVVDSDDTHMLKKDSTIETAEGTLHVHPFRKKGSRRVKAVLSFVPRASTFDRENVASGSDPFRGFFTLFWISVFLLSIRTYVTSFETSGYPLSMSFATLLSRDAKTLLFSDIILVSATAVAVPFMKIVQKGWIRYYYTGVIIQHLYQALFLGSAVAWTFNRAWPWVQSGFFTLHSLTMLMKMHSYCSVNGHLSAQDIRYAKTLKKLEGVCQNKTAVGGWETALKVSAQRREDALRAKILAESIDLTVSSEGTGESTPAAPLGSTALEPLPTHSAGLRQRLLTVQAQNQSYTAAAPAPRSPTDFNDEFAEGRHPLCYHPDEEVSELANALTEFDAELVSSTVQGNKKSVRWPNNISLWNFMDYQLIPSLVYEMQYPRTERLRPLYLLEKTVATFGTFTLLYTVTEHYIIPLTPNAEQPFLRSIVDLILPFMLCYLLLFYIIFECICNGFAELSFFADREFYEDWWNATTWDEYARKWNKPVHTFLLRHVYASTISFFKLSKGTAAFLTFLLSALAHELVMAVVTQKIRLYLFLLQMIQIPLIALGRLPIIRRNKTVGNIVFWFGLLTGFPLLCVAYCAY